MVILFFASFLAATLLPAQSEGILWWQLYTGNWPAWALILCATAGNVLGAWVNWWLGKWASSLCHKKWFPFSDQQLQKAQRTFNRYGRWTLLFACAPVIGDPLTAAAGILNVPMRVFLPLVTVGKGVRYIMIWWLFLAWKSGI